MKEQKTIKCTRCCAEIKAKTNEKVLKCSICGREYENPYYIDKTTQTKGKRENATQRNFIKDFVLDEEVYSSKKKKYTDLAIACLLFSFVAAFMSLWDSFFAIILLSTGRGYARFETYIGLVQLVFTLFCIVASSLALKRRKQPIKKDCVNLAIAIAFSAAITVWYLVIVILNVKAYTDPQNQSGMVDMSGLIFYLPIGIVPKVVYSALCGAMLTTLKQSAKKSNIENSCEREDNQEQITADIET